jgi:hypothetical protein
MGLGMTGDGGPLPPARLAAPTATLGSLRATHAGERLDSRHPLGDRVVAAAVEAVRVRQRAPRAAVPGRLSDRSLFGADLHLAAADGSTWWVDPQDLVLRGGAPVPPVLTEAIVVVHPDRYPTGFGALRASLALLEAGHVAATLALTGWRAGLAARVELGAGPTSVVRVALDDGAARDADDVVGPLEACTTPATDTLETWLDRRSGGWWGTGLAMDDAVDRGRHYAVVGAVLAARAALADVLPGDDALHVYEHHLGDHVPAVGELRRIDGLAALAPGEAPGPSSGLTLTARVDAWLEAYGDAASTVLNTALGWITQWGALAATAHRVTARPARAHVDVDWGGLPGLPDDQVPVHQLWLRSWPSGADDRAAPPTGRGDLGAVRGAR